MQAFSNLTDLPPSPLMVDCVAGRPLPARGYMLYVSPTWPGTGILVGLLMVWHSRQLMLFFLQVIGWSVNRVSFIVHSKDVVTKQVGSWSILQLRRITIWKATINAPMKPSGQKQIQWSRRHCCELERALLIFDASENLCSTEILVSKRLTVYDNLLFFNSLTPASCLLHSSLVCQSASSGSVCLLTGQGGVLTLN